MCDLYKLNMLYMISYDCLYRCLCTNKTIKRTSLPIFYKKKYKTLFNWNLGKRSYNWLDINIFIRKRWVEPEFLAYTPNCITLFFLWSVILPNWVMNQKDIIYLQLLVNCVSIDTDIQNELIQRLYLTIKPIRLSLI